MPGPTATWNPARGVWETAETSILCGHSGLYSETFPTSGSMRSGSLFPPRRSAPRTGASGSSSSPGRLLKTPTTQLAINGGSQHPDKRKAGGHGPTLADEVEHLLPTPKTSDTGTPGRRASEGFRPPLSQVVLPLLPTPWASGGEKGGPNQRGSSGDLMLPSAVAHLLPTPRARDGKGCDPNPRGGDLNQAVSLLLTPTATPYGNNQSPSAGAAIRPSLESLVPMLAPPADAASTPTTPEGSAPPARRAPIPSSGVQNSLLPTPMAADGERAILAMPRGNPTLAGAVELLPTPTSQHSARNATANRTDPKPTTDVTGWTLQDVFWAGDPTPPRSNGGKRSSADSHPGQLTIADA